MSIKSRLSRAGTMLGLLTSTALLARGGVASAVTSNAPASRQSPSQKADAAVDGGADGVTKALQSGNVQVANELLTRATVTDSDVAPTTTGAISARTTCHRAVTHRTTIALSGVTFGWREVRVGGWCWDGGRIISSQGASYNRYSAFLYCWTNESTFNGWYNFPTRRFAYTRGTLGGNSGFGCVGVGNTIAPAIYYRDGGSYSYTA